MVHKANTIFKRPLEAQIGIGRCMVNILIRAILLRHLILSHANRTLLVDQPSSIPAAYEAVSNGTRVVKLLATLLPWQTDKSSACPSQSPSLGPWFIDFSATNNISGNQSLFSSLTTTNKLPFIITINSSHAQVNGIGNTHPLPTLILDVIIMDLIVHLIYSPLPN